MAKKSRKLKMSVNGGTHSTEEWLTVCRFYGNKCLACGVRASKEKLTKDHVIPICKGGINDITNLQPLCRRCNHVKSDSIIDYRTTFGFIAYRNRLVNVISK